MTLAFRAASTGPIFDARYWSREKSAAADSCVLIGWDNLAGTKADAFCIDRAASAALRIERFIRFDCWCINDIARTMCR